MPYKSFANRELRGRLSKPRFSGAETGPEREAGNGFFRPNSGFTKNLQFCPNLRLFWAFSRFGQSFRNLSELRTFNSPAPAKGGKTPYADYFTLEDGLSSFFSRFFPGGGGRGFLPRAPGSSAPILEAADEVGHRHADSVHRSLLQAEPAAEQGPEFPGEGEHHEEYERDDEPEEGSLVLLEVEEGAPPFVSAAAPAWDSGGLPACAAGGRRRAAHRRPGNQNISTSGASKGGRTERPRSSIL